LVPKLAARLGNSRIDLLNRFTEESFMIALELELPESTYTALQEAAAHAHKSEAEVALTAIQTYLSQLANIDPLLGLFADDILLIDQVEADIMQTRELASLRLPEANGY
jgi:hypothetical protein